MVANAPLRGANNIGFPRPMGAILVVQCDSSSNNNNSKYLQRRAEELHSQDKSLFPLVFLMLYNPLNSNRSRSSNQVQGTSFIVDSSTPPPHLEAQAAGVAQTHQPAPSPAPTLSVYLYQYLHLPNGKLTENNRNNKAELWLICVKISHFLC